MNIITLISKLIRRYEITAIQLPNR